MSESYRICNILQLIAVLDADGETGNTHGAQRHYGKHRDGEDRNASARIHARMWMCEL